MSNNYMTPDIKKKSGIFLKALIWGIAVTVLMMVIFAAVMYLFDLPQKYAVALATVCVAAGSFASSFYASKKINSKGYKVGFSAGLITFFIVTALSLIISKNGFTYNTLFHLIIIIVSSLLGGITGVNSGKNKKYI